MNRKKKIILSAVLTAVGICAVILALVWRPQKPDAGLSPSHSAATTAPQETTGQSQTMEPDATEESTGPTASASTASDPTWEPAPSGSATEPPEEASGSETEGSPETVAPTAPPETVAEQTGEISFPYAIPDTGLVIQKIAAYDGVFLEDGTDEEITGVAAMVLENTGETAVEYTRISLNAGGETWSFEATAIPAGQTVVVQEADRAAYRDAVLTGCTADVAELEAMEMSEDQVRVTDNGDNSLTVTNLTQEPIVCVRVFYKYYMEDLDVYVGGIAYTAKVTDLQPGEEVQIIPSHYAAGSSRIVMVRTYDTE